MERFQRSGTHGVVSHGEAASSNSVAADGFVTECQYVEAKGLVPNSVQL